MIRGQNDDEIVYVEDDNGGSGLLGLDVITLTLLGTSITGLVYAIHNHEELGDLKAQIELHIEGFLPLEDLAAWAEDVFRDEEFEEPFVEQMSDLLSTLRDAVDPHRFRWEEPDFEQMLEELNN